MQHADHSPSDTSDPAADTYWAGFWRGFRYGVLAATLWVAIAAFVLMRW
jgi:hypothetical protein